MLKRSLSPSSSSSSSPLPDLQTLSSIFSLLHGQSWTHTTGWTTLPLLPTSHEIYGITLDNDNNVTSIELSSNNLTGTLTSILPYIKQLVHLTHLWLSNNNLSGNLSSDFLKIENLKVFDVGCNHLTGVVDVEFVDWKICGRFELVDFHGNEVTSFYRYVGDEKFEKEEFDAWFDGVDTITKSSPNTENEIRSIHLTTDIIPQETCASIIKSAEHHAEVNGWCENRHASYLTTDIDVASTPSLFTIINPILKRKIIPLLQKLYKINPISQLLIKDIFLIKYTSKKGGQNYLQPHKDDSVLSFILPLNPPSEYIGGGTSFLQVQEEGGGVYEVHPKNEGSICTFCGLQLHCGLQVTDGTRYVLAGFMDVCDSGVMRRLGEEIFRDAKKKRGGKKGKVTLF